MTAAPASDGWDRDAFLRSPLYASVRDGLARLPADRFPQVEDLDALTGPSIVTASGRRVRFVASPQAGDDGEHYELRIARTGAVATRPGNWHDLFNALAWCAFPRTKAALNAVHARLLAASPDEARHRGALRDVATLFDEGGAIVACADPALAALLRAHAWTELFVAARARVADAMRCRVFGHALLERARGGYRGITAKVLVLEYPQAVLDAPDLAASLDADAAARFAMDDALAPGARAERWRAALTPLPLFGWPDWDPSNRDPLFYADTRYFRPKRRAARDVPAASGDEGAAARAKRQAPRSRGLG